MMTPIDIQFEITAHDLIGQVVEPLISCWCYDGFWKRTIEYPFGLHPAGVTSPFSTFHSTVMKRVSPTKAASPMTCTMQAGVWPGV